ncbi:MAG: hypothetical protein QOI98_281 [Solirubrobacteraceae bacterium]|nr:hypothetical protein [Solirubrobacteraceae bacterium]
MAGGTGAIGRPLVPALLAAGHEVVALARSRESAERLRAQGAEPALGDALDRDAVVEAVRVAYPDAVVHQLTAIPRALRPRRFAEDFALTNRLRTEGTRNLLDGAAAAGTERFVAQSIAFAYAPGGPTVKDEDAPLWLDSPRSYHPVLDALVELEGAVTAAGGAVLRYGQLYGPGTMYAADGSIAGEVRRRRMPIVGDGGGVASFVHVEDAAQATVAALETGATGIFNVVDDEPAPAREWLPVYAALLGAPPPRRVPRGVVWLVAGALAAHFTAGVPGASNRRAREVLGWTPSRPTWRDGFAAELA